MMTRTFEAALRKHGIKGVEPRYVAAYFFLGTPMRRVDDMTEREFDEELEVAVSCARTATKAESEKLAQSFGL